MDKTSQITPQSREILQDTAQWLQNNQSQFATQAQGQKAPYSIHERVQAIQSVLQNISGDQQKG